MPPMRLSRLVLTLFYLAGPLLIISELFTPALSIPILLLSVAYIVLLVPSPPSRPSRRCESVARLTSCRGICSIRALRRLGLLLRHRKFRQMPLGLCEAQSDLLISAGSETADPYHTLWQGFHRPLQLRLLHYACAALPSRACFSSWHHTQRRIADNLFGRAVPRHERPLPWTDGICSRPACHALPYRRLGLCLACCAFGVEPQGEISTSWVTLQVPFNLDWWGIPYAPQSFTMNLYYAPQHFFGALIGTALLYASLQSSQPAAARLIETIIVIAASVFWSPYVAVGLAALAVVLAFSLDDTWDVPSAIETRRDLSPYCARRVSSPSRLRPPSSSPPLYFFRRPNPCRPLS